MIVSCLQTPIFGNLGKHLQLHRFNTCLPTTTIFPIYITDILVLLLALQNWLHLKQTPEDIAAVSVQTNLDF